MARDFTSDWFSSAIPGIERTLGSHCRDPRNILEIGSWEGRSACWFLDRYSDARITCIDTFAGAPGEYAGLDVDGTKARFLRNVAGFGDRVTLRQGASSRELYGLKPESFDVVYVDGSHAEDDALLDLVLSYGLLQPGGVMLVDDYRGGHEGVRRAVDAFAAAFSGTMEPVLQGYQIHFVKKWTSLQGTCGVG